MISKHSKAIVSRGIVENHIVEKHFIRTGEKIRIEGIKPIAIHEIFQQKHHRLRQRYSAFYLRDKDIWIAKSEIS